MLLCARGLSRTKLQKLRAGIFSAGYPIAPLPCIRKVPMPCPTHKPAAFSAFARSSSADRHRNSFSLVRVLTLFPPPKRLPDFTNFRTFPTWTHNPLAFPNPFYYLVIIIPKIMTPTALYINILCFIEVPLFKLFKFKISSNSYSYTVSIQKAQIKLKAKQKQWAPRLFT